MGRGIFEKLLSSIEKKGEALLDYRRNTEGNFRYSISDALKCAFGVFFFQYPSMLSFQRKMQDKHRRNNITKDDMLCFCSFIHKIMKIVLSF
jgi:hypothetical protein